MASYAKGNGYEYPMHPVLLLKSQAKINNLLKLFKKLSNILPSRLQAHFYKNQVIF